MQKKIKSFVKKIVGINTNITKSSFKEENFCKSLKCLVNDNPDLLSNNSHVGKRKDGKNFYYEINKIADGFDFINNELDNYGDKNIPDINEYDGFQSGTPMDTKPFSLCISNVKKLLRKKNLYTYQSTTGDIYEKEKIVNYLSREGFKINSDKNYDGIGVDNIVFTCSTTQAFSVILNVIMKEEDVILMTGPNYGLFALEPERLNGRVEILPLKEEDDWYVNPDSLSKKIDEINEELKKEFKGKSYIPRVKAFLNMNPHNPMGRVMNNKNKELLYKIGDVCLEKGVFVIDDLIYRDLTFDRESLALPLASNPKYFNNTISLFGLSKSYGLASFRAAFIVAPIPICRGISSSIFQYMDSIPTPQIAAVCGAYNGTDRRYKEYNKYFSKIMPEYIYRYNLFKCLLNGIDTVDKKYHNRIKKDIYKYEKDNDIRNKLLSGIKDINLLCTVDSGFFAVLDFTKLKHKKYKDMCIENDMDLLKYLYIKGKMKCIMGYNMSWPEDGRLIARVNFSVPIKALINNMKILNNAVEDLK